MTVTESKKDVRVINRAHAEYPGLLATIENPPLALYVRGALPSPRTPWVAMVGTRKATEAGSVLARQIACDLSSRGVVVVSGLAMGIDAAAHEGALEGGSPTVVVLGVGIDTIYPRMNERLAMRILEANGAILSEYAPGTPARKYRFLERNRIVSGLCSATIIIEAPQRSGSLVTARLAAEQGRDVFVFPGPARHPNYRGSHALIRDGARLVSSLEDILEDIGFTENGHALYPRPPAPEESSSAAFHNADQARILQCIAEAGAPLRIDKIIERTKLEPQVVNQALAFLLLARRVKETEYGYAI